MAGRLSFRARVHCSYSGCVLLAFSVAPATAPVPLASPEGPAPAEPSSAQPSVATAVADAVRVVRDSGLPNRTDAMFTTIEGSWDECLDVVRRACDAVARHGERVSLVLKADIRTAPGRESGQIDGKVERLEAALERVEGEPGRGQ